MRRWKKVLVGISVALAIVAVGLALFTDVVDGPDPFAPLVARGGR